MPFVGPSGQRLNRWLRAAGLEPHKLLIMNIVQCWLPGDRPPRATEVEACRARHWGATLDSLNPKVIVTVGVPAGKAVFGPKYTAKMAGHIKEL